ncbi:MAG: SusC/RagA family TonB-linked outer membrane protein, partial [Bacteroidales bacterium]|nr:SusC/RagA family TonB-linked outer membrane protein [Bacteroidales bacterium]
MKKVKLFLTCLLAVLTTALYAQNRQISGTVTDPDGNPMPGVAVFVEGTNVGTVTDANGAYTLNMRGGDVVKFTFFGMRDVIVPVENQGRVDIRMEEDTIGLDEVVITATGMTRQEKTLGYASTTVRSEEILKGHAADALSGLSGKVAGVQISSSGGTGTSQKVIVRGYSSFSNNAPLYVIDGVPVSNSTMGTQDLNNSIDFGNQAADINPEDIESITVLKGASATALYGSRAGNGAIIITTKRGDQNEAVKVTYDGSFQVSSVLRIPNIQNRFGQGWFYSYDGYNFENYSPTENGSWGNLLDGRDVIWRPGAAEQGYNPGEYDDVYKNPEYHTDYSYKKNSLRNFYTTGFEANNTITVQGGSKNTGFVASYGNIYSDGILPGNTDYYKRNNFSFRGNTKIKEGLAWLNYSINYIRKDVRNAMTGQGGSGSTIYQDILQYPVNIDYADVRDWHSVLNNADNFYTPYAQNPWWTLDNNYSTYTDDRVYGSAEFGLQLAKGLQFIARGGADITNFIQKEFDNIWTFSPGSYAENEGASAENGKYEEYVRRNSQIDANFLLNADYRLGQDFSIHGVAGVNVNQRNSAYTVGTLEGIAVSGWASFENTSGATPKAESYMTNRRLIGAYAQADFGWRDAVYLTLSARNDWSSTLPINKNSYFY